MLPIIIGVVLIILGLFLLPFGYGEFKEELKTSTEDLPFFKRLIFYILTFWDLGYLELILALSLLLVFSGGAFIILAIF